MRIHAGVFATLAVAALLVIAGSAPATPTIGSAVDISPAERLDKVGTAAVMHGDTMILGTYSDDHAGSLSGSAWIYTDENGVWKPHTKLTSGDDASDGDYFGWAVDLEGDTAVVGAYSHFEEDGQAGAVYVFTRNANGQWTRTAKLLAPERTSYFGYAVDLQGDRMVIGSWLTSDAWVFERENGVWKDKTKLVPTNAEFRDYFGTAVALDGDRILVGSWYAAEASASRPGAAYVFELESGTWKQKARLVSKVRADLDYFGWAVELEGDTAVIGAPRLAGGTGAAFVFIRGANGTWAETQRFGGTMDGGGYGRTLALGNGTLLVSERRAHRVEVFTNGASGFAKQTTLTRKTDPFYAFGHDVTFCGSRGFIGNGQGGIPIEGLPSPELTLADEGIPVGTTGRPGSWTFAVEGGVSPLHVSVVDGSLPVSGTLDPETGMLDGATYLAPGTYAYTVRVTDGCGATVERAFETVVNERPTLDDALPVAVVGRPYEAALPVRGGTAPFRFQLVSRLDPGLGFDEDTGVLSGIPTTAGQFTLEFVATDASGARFVELPATLRIAPVSDLASRKAKETVPGGDADIVRALELLRGTRLDAKMKLPKGSPAYDVLLYGPDGAPVSLDGSLETGSRSFKLKKLEVAVTGRYLLMVRTDGELPGTSKLKLTVSAPKKWTLEGDLAAGETATADLAALPGSTAKIQLSRDGGDFLPAILEMRDDRDRELLEPDAVAESSKKARATVGGLPGGDLRLRVGGRDGSAGRFVLKIKLKLPGGYGFTMEDVPQSASVVLDE
jgi:hypothetical protein